MQFRVVIPENDQAGQTIRIHCHDGTEANVKVPKGSKPGDSFIFEMSVDQLKDPQGLLESARKEEQEAAAASAATTAEGRSQPRVVSYHELLLSLLFWLCYCC